MIRKRELLEDLHALVLELRREVKDLKIQVRSLSQTLDESFGRNQVVQSPGTKEIMPSSSNRVVSEYLIIDDEYLKESKE